MKILLYTISDFKPFSLECIDLLLSSITKDICYDFCIISNTAIDNHSTKHNILIDSELKSNYIGYLKYSPKIPPDYDYYIYLDSDILYFDKLSKLIRLDKKYTLVYENEKINRNPWWYFHHSGSDTTLLEKSQAINAGSFCFAKSEYPILKDIYNTYANHITDDVHSNAQLEQSIFNYYIYNYTNFETHYVYDISSFAQLFASNYPIQNDKKLYHFCGFTNEMASKYIRMKKFNESYIDRK